MTMSLPEALTTEIAKAIGIKSTKFQISLRKPLDFQSNSLYDIWGDGLHFIAKEYIQPDELAIAPLREYNALQLLASLDIAPRPVFFEPTVGPIVVYEYMEGEMWDRRSVSTSDLSKLIDVWLKINSVPADWVSRGFERSLQVIEQEFHQRLESYIDWSSAEFKLGKRAADVCMQLLENRHAVIKELSEHTPTLCFCRADPRFANVIQRPNGQLGLIDWEDSGLRDPAREVADILTHPNQEDLVSWEEWQVFIEPYMRVRSKLDIGITRRTHLYLAIFPLFWLTMLLRRGVRLASTGQLADWTIKGLTGDLRLRRYLARALAWPSMEYKNILDELESLEFFPK
jgi:aminoglycoside phosphotransferase (APT) family kinase protein